MLENNVIEKSESFVSLQCGESRAQEGWIEKTLFLDSVASKTFKVERLLDFIIQRQIEKWITASSREDFRALMEVLLRRAAVIRI